MTSGSPAPVPGITSEFCELVGGAEIARFVRNRVPRGDAEDVLQNTAMEAFRSIGSFDPTRGPMTPWLIKVARRRIADYYRTDARMTRIVDRLAAQPEGTAALTPDEWVDLAGGSERMLAALGRIPENQRLVLVLREVQGRSHAEIAEILGVSEGASHQLLNRARKGLRALLSRNDGA